MHDCLLRLPSSIQEVACIIVWAPEAIFLILSAVVEVNSPTVAAIIFVGYKAGSA